MVAQTLAANTLGAARSAPEPSAALPTTVAPVNQIGTIERHNNYDNKNRVRNSTDSVDDANKFDNSSNGSSTASEEGNMSARLNPEPVGDSYMTLIHSQTSMFKVVTFAIVTTLLLLVAIVLSCIGGQPQTLAKQASRAHHAHLGLRLERQGAFPREELIAQPGRRANHVPRPGPPTGARW